MTEMRVTASKVSLLGDCAWSFRDDAAQDPYRASEAAERGTRFHSAIERYTNTRQRSVVEEDIEMEYLHACAWVDEYVPGHSLTEVAMGWDPATDTAVRYDVTSRGYPKDGKLHGTADLVVVGSGQVWAYDWKTGDGSGAGPQLRALALMLGRIYPGSVVHVAALEASKSGVEAVAAEILDAFSLDAVAAELAEQIAAIPTAEPVPGSHCGEKYCNARLSCPLGQAATTELVPVEHLTRKITDPITTPEQAAWALDVCRLVGARLDAIKEEIKAKVPSGGWALDDGRVLRETHAEIKAFDKHKALALCKQLGATEEQMAALWYTFEKSNGLRISGGSAKPRKRKAA